MIVGPTCAPNHIFGRDRIEKAHRLLRKNTSVRGNRETVEGQIRKDEEVKDKQDLQLESRKPESYEGTVYDVLPTVVVEASSDKVVDNLDSSCQFG